VNNDSAIPQSILLSNHEFNITGLYPSYHLYVTVAAITPSIRGSDISLPLIYPFGNGKTLSFILSTNIAARIVIIGEASLFRF